MRNVRFLSVITAAMFGMYSFAFGQQADTTFSVTVEGNVGIGTTSPTGRLEVIGDGTSNPAIIAKNEGNSNSHTYIRAIGASEQQTTRPIFDGRRSRGTIVNPTDVAPDDRILSLLGNPYIDGTYRSNVSIEMFVGEAPGINSYPAYIGFFTTANSETIRRERIRITSEGNIGIGTTNPGRRLHVVSENSNAQIILGDPLAGSDLKNWFLQSRLGEFRIGRFDDAVSPGGILNAVTVSSNGNVGIGTTNPVHPLQMASGAHVTTGGVWTDASSRYYKENISNLTPEEAILALEKLNPVKFNYKVEKDEKYVGFIAEDVPDLVATIDRKSLSPMNIVAVLTKVVQQQQKKIAELETRLNASQ